MRHTCRVQGADDVATDTTVRTEADGAYGDMMIIARTETGEAVPVVNTVYLLGRLASAPERLTSDNGRLKGFSSGKIAGHYGGTIRNEVVLRDSGPVLLLLQPEDPAGIYGSACDGATIGSALPVLAFGGVGEWCLDALQRGSLVSVKGRLDSLFCNDTCCFGPETYLPTEPEADVKGVTAGADVYATAVGKQEQSANVTGRTFCCGDAQRAGCGRSSFRHDKSFRRGGERATKYAVRLMAESVRLFTGGWYSSHAGHFGNSGGLLAAVQPTVSGMSLCRVQ